MEKLMNVGTMDNYYEQIVQKKFNSKMLATLIMSMVGIVVAIFLSIYLSIYFNWLVPVSLLLLGIGIWLIWFLIKNSGVEYEYTFVLGELRIERIKGRSRRKNVTAFDVKAIDDIGLYFDPESHEHNVNPKDFPLVLRAAANEKDGLIHDKVRHKPALLLFSPNDTTLEKIKPYLSVELKKKYLKLQKESQKAKEQSEKAE